MEPSTLPACYRFIVNGRMQGVFFRQSTQEQAQELGLSGWVRNRDDGRVEGLACGDPVSLAALRDWLAEGPPAARVDTITWDATDQPPQNPGFEVRR